MTIDQKREFLIVHKINVRQKIYDKARLTKSIHTYNKYIGVAQNLDMELHKLQNVYSEKWIEETYNDLTN